MGRENKKLIASDKKARFDYSILKTFETGIELPDMEVKVLRMRHCSVKESRVGIRNGETFIYGMHINPYKKGNIFNKDPLRMRKLLVHKSEIHHLIGAVKEEGSTLVPLEMYLEDRPTKVEIGLIQGKKKYDKRATTAKNDARRDLERNFRGSA